MVNTWVLWFAGVMVSQVNHLPGVAYLLTVATKRRVYQERLVVP